MRHGWRAPSEPCGPRPQRERCMAPVNEQIAVAPAVRHWDVHGTSSEASLVVICSNGHDDTRSSGDDRATARRAKRGLPGGGHATRGASVVVTVEYEIPLSFRRIRVRNCQCADTTVRAIRSSPTSATCRRSATFARPRRGTSRRCAVCSSVTASRYRRTLGWVACPATRACRRPRSSATCARLSAVPQAGPARVVARVGVGEAAADEDPRALAARAPKVCAVAGRERHLLRRRGTVFERGVTVFPTSFCLRP